MRSQQKSAIMRTPLKLKMIHWLQNFMGMGMRQPLQVLKTVSAHQVHHLGQGQTQQNDASFITSGPLSPFFFHKNTCQTYYSEPKNCSLGLFLYMSLSLFPVSLSLFIWHTHTHLFTQTIVAEENLIREDRLRHRQEYKQPHCWQTAIPPFIIAFPSL